MWRQQPQPESKRVRPRCWYLIIELSDGSFQLNVTNRSPGALENPAGAAGTDAGGEDAAEVVADTSLAGPNPAAFLARTWNLYAAPEGSF